MAKKDSRNTKGRIVDAAWALFYEQGYDETTIDDIVERSETSKGSFYHYFESKDSLLSSLSYLFDAKYEQLMQEINPDIVILALKNRIGFHGNLYLQIAARAAV